ncbi:unnamed protein product [Owenia fusiformis]|uniref:Uncharacterized protein n=1 Tax=Owenia fusiformis TaxID=6347 RepID=A0A8J1XTU0_OWEFU|nr:unnamed protein product [Owenia fusiformis]
MANLVFFALCSLCFASHASSQSLDITAIVEGTDVVITGGPTRVFVNTLIWNITVLDDRWSDVMLRSSADDISFGYSTWLGIDPHIYSGYSFRVSTKLKQVKATGVEFWTKSDDRKSIVFLITTEDPEHWIRFQIGDFTETHFSISAKLFNENTDAKEPGSKYCYDIAKEVGDDVFRALKDLTPNGICDGLDICSKSTHGLYSNNFKKKMLKLLKQQRISNFLKNNTICDLCLEVFEKLSSELHSFLPNPEQNIEETMMSLCDQTGQYRLDIGFQGGSEEGFFGFGERFNGVNQRGNSLYCWTEDGGFSLNILPDTRIPHFFTPTETYIPSPYFVSSRGYGLYMNTTFRTSWDMLHTNGQSFSIQNENTEMQLIVLTRRTPLENMQTYTALTGRPLIPPTFEFGPWIRASQEIHISDNVQAFQKLHQMDIPSSVLFDSNHFFPEGGDHSNTKKTTNEKLKTMGIIPLAYFNSMISTSYIPVFEEAENSGYLIKLNNQTYIFSYKGAGPNPFKVGMIDFTAPGAVDWYGRQLNQSVLVSYNGFTYDYGEYIDPECTFHNGMTGREMHNLYPVLYQEAAYSFFETFDANPDDEYAPPYVYCCRSGYSGSGKSNWATWTGDPMCDWSNDSGLPAQVHAMLSASISGISFIGSDIGGFVWFDPPSAELWCRWAQVGAFSGIMRTQDGGTAMSGQPKSHILDTPEGVYVWRKMAKLRTALFPYIYTSAHASHYEGIPIMRHHILSFADDPTARAIDTQYMFGPDFLVAPVIEEHSKKQLVYLPRSSTDIDPVEWYDISQMNYDNRTDGRFRVGNTKLVSGGQSVVVDAPLDIVPIFVRAGAAVPTLDPSVWSLGNSSDPSFVSLGNRSNILHWWVWPNKTGGAIGRSYDGTYIVLHQLSKRYIGDHYKNGDVIRMSIDSDNSDMGNEHEVAIKMLEIYDRMERTAIIQIALPDIGAQPIEFSVTDDRNYVYKMAESWKVLSDITMPTSNHCQWFFDTDNLVLWIKGTFTCNDLSSNNNFESFGKRTLTIRQI